MYILWSPEHGQCSVCGQISRLVRRYTTQYWHRIFCQACWNANTDNYHVITFDWNNDENIIFIVSNMPVQPSGMMSVA
jgi:hypothetical protein